MVFISLGMMMMSLFINLAIKKRALIVMIFIFDPLECLISGYIMMIVREVVIHTVQCECMNVQT